ncbi:MAG: YggS family pyridoxal phosphate-dependent enzyme [Rhodospirillales bacterium]|nr:YggS family pyridoxal phosphate-dependent enzyme [Rhodospirillales bacterium]
MNDQDIENNLRTVQAAVVQAAKDAARDPEAVTLVAVSKTKPTETIHKALLAGHRSFGENRVQESLEKWPALKDAFPDTQLHLIGPLQTNKIKDVLGLFDVIQTVDRIKLATKLADAMAATGHRPDCFIQVNTGEEPQKAGVLPADADAFIRACVDDCALPVRGLMCIPPADEEPVLHFALLREIARRNGLSGLSMGMSDDFEAAIRFGATHVRVGSAIFGAR